MKRTKAAPAPTPRLIRIGGEYRDTVRDVLVTAEDHEISHGRRTGRVVVCAADGKERFPRRWYCAATDLEDAQEDLPLLPTSDGVNP
jgi:hypothetical protein